ncbi:hypothetical protein AcV5_009084 [Taiwanofungus camphoratus]|nr:hypothetical protein AcV5_009084 [Antrodia cinnamomea]
MNAHSGCQRAQRLIQWSGRSHSRHSSWKTTIETKNSSVNALVYAANGLSVPENSNSDLPLYGLSVAVKDNICTSSMPTTCSSAMLQNFISPFDATVVKLLQDNGAAILGKTNCDEFGMGSLNVYSVHGPVINPHQPPHSLVRWVDRERRSAGGSSGGSAAAVAAGMCDAALATDTGGSIRLPASYCGVVGLKPSYGIISRWGVVSYADSLDCVGVMAKRVKDVQRVFKILSVYDPNDPTAASPATRQRASDAHQESWFSSRSNGSLIGLRIGVPQEYFPAELQPSMLKPVKRVLNSLRARGASLVPVSLPSTPYALSAYYVISSAEASSNMARYDGIQYGLHVAPPPDVTKTSSVYAYTRSRGFGPEVRKRILLGAYALTADAFDNYFLQAQRVRKIVRRDFDRVFSVRNILSSSENSTIGGMSEDSRVHVLLHPSSIQTAPHLPPSELCSNSAQAPVDGGLESYVQDVLTVPASLAGLPALNVPVGLGEDGWPVGISLVGQWGCDEMVMEVGKMCEEDTL